MEFDELAPSVELLHALTSIDRCGLDLDGVVTAIAGWERILSWATACQHELLVQAAQTVDTGGDGGAHRTGHPDVTRWFCDRLGLALGVTGGSAGRRLDTALTLTEKLPSVAAALKSGELTSHHARLLAGDAITLPDAVALDADKVAMAADDWRTPTQLQTVFRQAVLTVDPDGAADRANAQRRGRRVSCRNEPDGMATLWALLPAEQCQAVTRKVEAHARSSAARNNPDDCRTLDQRRADALVDLVLRENPTGEAAGSEPTLHGRRPEICVTVAWSTLIGADNAPADLTGYGPIDATTARRIAADPNAVWRRLLLDPASGRLLEYGRSTYRPPRDLADHVVARDRTCRFPTCDHPAIVCDHDHRRQWARDGRTDEDNLDALCRRHHRLKDEAEGWQHERDDDSQASIWTDPDGTEHQKPATELPTPPPVEPPDHDPPPF